MTPDAGVRCDVDGLVAAVTLTRPERRNAQTPLTWAALRAIGADLPAEVRAVVVRGEGVSFSAGIDRAMLTGERIAGSPSLLDGAHTRAEEAERAVERFQEAFTWLARPDIISVAAVQGHAIGAGFQLALACDVRIATENAVFIMAETSLGLVPDLGGTRILRELVGYSRAIEICATGREVGAAEAARIGLVNAVLEFLNAVLAPPHAAVAETKGLLLGAALRAPAEQLLAERQAQLRRIRDLAGVGG